MIHDVDDALRALIGAENSDGTDVSFDAPTREWASRQNTATINVFLYDIREDVGRRDVAMQVVRDTEGKIIERRPPARRFKLSYLLSAWTQRSEDEHRLLAGLLSQFLKYDAIPEEMLTGSLADASVPVVLQMALPPTQDRSLADVWSALGGELKPSIDLIVVAPLDPQRVHEVGPPVLEEPRVTIEGRVTDASPRSPLGDGASGERLIAGTEEQPGRVLVTRRRDRPIDHLHHDAGR